MIQNSVHSSNSGESFPVILVALIGILATACLLVSYYIFIIKFCLNWHRVDLLRRLNLSRTQQEPSQEYSPAIESRGLEESIIRSIPVFQYKKTTRIVSECSVCLNEFEEDEKLRIIPNCSHFFHIDCLDIWLQKNPNCPLCRTLISPNTHFSNLPPSSYPQDPIPYSHTHFDQNEDCIEILVANNDSSSQNQTLFDRQGTPISGEVSVRSIIPSPEKFKFTSKRKGKLSKVTSMGDECIDIREKDKQFSEIQPIRRSFSVNSSADRQICLAIPEDLQKNRDVLEVSPDEDCSNRIRKSFFSFGHGRGFKNAVLPLHLDP